MKRVARFISRSGKHIAELIRVEDCDSCELLGFDITVSQNDKIVEKIALWRTQDSALEYFYEAESQGRFQPDGNKTPMRFYRG